MNKNNYFKFSKKKVINYLDQEPIQILDSVSLNYYMIHCIEHTYREKFIGDLILKLNKPINMFDGIYTKNVSLDDQINFIANFNKNLIANFKFYLQGQIGCYLSHFKIIENIMNNNLNYDYSVIFEDDVIFGKYLNSNINKIIIDLNSLNVDFDLIFLGNCNNNKGAKLINNIYYIDNNNNCWGTHGLLINNKNIKKIYDLNCNITNEIDTHYASLLKNKKLNGFVIYPSLCLQNSNLISTIKKN